MDKRYKKYLKLNIMSLFFAGLSFISITLAWFAYSGLVTAKTEINVKTWSIAFTQDGQPASNNIIIPLTTITPGMQTVSETINIKNNGDTDAALSYEITSARILDQTYKSNGKKGYLEDLLAQTYPFHINISLSEPYANANDGTGEFTVSVSWPLDGGNDEEDSDWGNKAHEFQKNEIAKQGADPTYQIQPTIKIEISLIAEQYLGDATSTDPDYKLGNIVLYNPVDNVKCTSLDEENCIKTFIIDKDNKIGDTNIKVIPDLNEYSELPVPFTSYESTMTGLKDKYKTTTKELKVTDITPIISKDVLETFVMGPAISNTIVGNIDYVFEDNQTRADLHRDKVVSLNGTYRFVTLKFPYFTTNQCVWLEDEYSTTHQFALSKIDGTYSKVYGEEKTNQCQVVPVFEIAKYNLEQGS